MCGEKVYGEQDKKISHIFEEVFHFITHFEGSFLRTLKLVITRPGKLSADYCNGIRKKYFKPVSLFLVLVVIYLLFPFFRGLNMNFYGYISSNSRYAVIARPIAEKKQKSHHITQEVLAATYNKKSPVFAKFFLLILIPLSSFLLAIIFYTSRRYLFDHFILATEIISFYILTNWLLFPLLIFLISQIYPHVENFFNSEGILTYIIVALMATYISVAFRNFYRQKKWISAVKGIFFWLFYVVSIQFVYTILLYLLVMLFI
jgi:hypothetical protein